MKSNRRDFIRVSGLTGLSMTGLVLTGINGLSTMTNPLAGSHGQSALPASSPTPGPTGPPGPSGAPSVTGSLGPPEYTGATGGASSVQTPGQLHAQIPYPDRFNMCGYAAPRLETVRIGFIGLGNRGPAAVERMTHIEGVAINALCDLRPEKTEAVRKKLEGGPHHPVVYTGGEEEWKKLCERPDIDLVYIATPWSLHTPMALYAMNQGKHVCVEVPAAKTIDECWQLVETSEQTRRHCMMLENCCYDFFELLTLNLARAGFFGEIIHGEGAYNHNLLEGNFSKTKYYDCWRLKENFRNGNLYPTHGLGPVAQVMDINRGDKMDFLVSLSGRDFMMGAMEKELAAKDDFYKPYAGRSFGGNVNTSLIRSSQGRTILIQHDETSPTSIRVSTASVAPKAPH